jgi:hypothetical protein
MGGKNVYFLLTPHERGRLQVLPVAYDVRRKEWYDVAASALRHFTEVTERAVHWTDPELTFNSSCHGCHVSQLSSNYDLSTDSYRTTWAEPGINCETCHGPGEEHIRAVSQAGRGNEKVPAGSRLITTRGFTHDQKNEMCAPCHARMSPLTNGFRPGDRYFDAFDLVGLESPDFYPDGRDLGETYTFTGWRGSACARSGQLDCLHCHTSSGRYRFKDASTADGACLPCHEARVQDGVAHSHHPDGKVACIDCHMPKTEFARMVRSDHSMRPPAPAATIAFGSPNACNGCHRDKAPAWSDRVVRKWHARDYQAPVLRRGALIAAARKRDWSELSAMLAAVARARTRRGDRSISAAPAGLVSRRRREEPAILAAMATPSPWVRAAAAETARRTSGRGCGGGAARDDARSGAPAARARRRRAGRPAQERRLPKAARGSRGGDPRAGSVAHRARRRLRFAGQPVGPLRQGGPEQRRRDGAAPRAGDRSKQRGGTPEPGHVARRARSFRGGRSGVARRQQGGPALAAAAYNLAVIVARDRPDEAVTWSRRASELEPASAKYAAAWPSIARACPHVVTAETSSCRR